MLSSVSSVRAAWAPGIVALLLLGAFALQGQLASSSLPPPEAGPSGLLLRPAAPEQVEALATGLRPGVRIDAVKAIKATSAAEASRPDRRWYVGVRLQGPDRRSRVAVWLVTGPKTRPGLLYSVGPAARTASVWPAGSEAPGAVSPVDAEALALFSALRSR